MFQFFAIASVLLIAVVCTSCAGIVSGTQSGSGPSPQITTSSLAGGQVQVAYSATLTATGGSPSYTWSVASGSLPPGLTLDASGGQIGGSPTQSGAFNFVVQVADSKKQTAQQSLSISVSAMVVSITVSPASATGIAGQVQWFVANVTGTSNKAVTWSVNGTAGGNSTVGSISSAATSVGKYAAPTTVPSPATVTVTATSQADSTKSASASVNIVAAVTGTVSVQTTGTTATQAVLTYTAPDSNPCTLQVQENSSSSPLVHDVDPTLFPGSNTDAGGAVNRIWVVGKRTVQPGLDGNNYSRALQNNTVHYFQITCGSKQSQGFFDTMNLPLGKTIGEPMVTDSQGSYIFPTVPNVRGYPVIDPMTGTLLKRVTLDTDVTTFDPSGWFSTGASHACANQLTNGGYRCIWSGTQGTPRMYWISPPDGSSKLLGFLRYSAGSDYIGGTPSASDSGNFDSQNPSVYYAIGSTSNTSPSKTVILMGTYTGNDVSVGADTLASFNWVNLTPAAGNHTLTDLIAAFDSRFNSVQYGQRCQIEAVQLNYLMIACLRNGQNSPGWGVVVNLGTKQPGGASVVASVPIFANPSTRWCGLHAMNYIGDTTAQSLSAHTMNDAQDTGPWQVTLQTTVGILDATFSVSGEPTTPNLPPDGINSLQNVAVGDSFLFDDGTAEVIKILTKVSSTSWLVQRGANGGVAGGQTTAQPHPAGAKLQAACNVANPDVWWKFLNDPHGTDATGTNYLVDGQVGGGHGVARDPFDIMASWTVRQGSFPGQFGQAPTFILEDSPAFAGIRASAAGNSYQKHPGYGQPNAPANEQLWFLDVLPFEGGLYQGDSATLVSGSLYKYNLAIGDSSTGHQLSAQMPYFALSGTTLLKDVSAPGSVLSDQAVDNFKFCIAKNAGECHAGSAAGDIYFNHPSLAVLACQPQFAPGTIADICIQNDPAYGEKLVQLGLQAANPTGTSSGVPRYGAGLSRALLSPEMLGYYRMVGGFANAHPLPDGSWALLPALYQFQTAKTNPANTIYAAKIPPYPIADGIDRSNFINVVVSVPALTGAANSQVSYGYEEYGARSAFHCTQRAEACSVSAAPGSQVTIQGIPQRILFYQITYFNSSGGTISSSPINTSVVP